MLDDERPDNEWDTEVRERVAAGEDEETVRAGVIKRYLDVCDPLPLLSSINKKRLISQATRRHIAAGFDKTPSVNEPVPYRFGVMPASWLYPRRNDAQQWRYRLKDYLEPDEDDCVQILMASLPLLAAGRRPKPPEEFPFPSIWDVLWKGLLLGHPELLHPDSPRPPPSPLLIRLEFREPLGHRPREPGLDTRNKALRRLVEKAVVGKEGLTKTEAIEKVGKECHLSFGTVRAAAYKKR